MPLIVKRLDARYDWLGRWGHRSYRLVDAGEGCEASDGVAGRVAWVSEGNCSFFTKVWVHPLSPLPLRLLTSDL